MSARFLKTLLATVLMQNLVSSVFHKLGKIQSSDEQL